MTKYILFDKSIIEIDEEKIVKHINNIANTKTYKRIGSGTQTFIVGQIIPQKFYGYYYESVDILLKANKLYDYSKDTCSMVRTYHENGNLKEEYFQINKIKNGVYKSYHSNNNIQIECNYVDDMLHGPYKKYYSNNNLILECNYKNGKLNEKYKAYADPRYNNFSDNTTIHLYCQKYTEYDKILYSESNYIDGILHGEYILKFNNHICTAIISEGIIETITLKNINRDKIIYYVVSKKYPIYEIKTFYESGELLELYYLIGLKKNDGKYTKYFKNGNINEEKIYDNNNMIYLKTFYDNANVNEIKEFDGIKYNFIKFYDNGILKEDSVYNKNNQLISQILYYKNGKTKSQSIWNEQSVKIYEEKYNENGLLIYYLDNYAKIVYTNNIDDKEKINKFIEILKKSLN
jgi:antitoxin component YwqK of YwqJK toxin-antitoxin module